MKVIIFSFLVLLADQFSKLYVKGFVIPFFDLVNSGLSVGESIPIFNNFLHITLVENPGMAFGFDPGSDFKLWLSLFSLIVSVGLLVYLYIVRNKALVLRVAIALILGGAIGNLVDKIFYGLLFDYAPLFYGRVVDFIDMRLFRFFILNNSYGMYIFNFADLAITAGVICFILFHYKQSKESQRVLIPVTDELNSEQKKY
ncbi:MAG: signal peptidase II [Ignavibacteria bacterium]|nr:signal peptidase II [Ignavibacteria bacterium]